MPVSRINSVFERTKTENRAALVAYIMAGDPDLDTSLSALHALVENGADIIELGAPFTDPMADGPAIQMAGQRSLKAGTTLSDVLQLASRFRESNSKTPLVVMGYANPIHLMGYDAFAAAAARAGVDGTIVVDLPPEEDAPLRTAYEPHDLAVIRLATPTTDRARMQVIADGASGFLYYVSVTGVTGAKQADPAAISDGVALAREVSGLPVCVGFGIKTGQQAADMAKVADGVVVGSAFVEQAKLASEAGNPNLTAKAMGDLARELSSALAPQ